MLANIFKTNCNISFNCKIVQKYTFFNDILSKYLDNFNLHNIDILYVDPPRTPGCLQHVDTILRCHNLGGNISST